MFYKIFKSSLVLILIAFVFSACSLPFKQKEVLVSTISPDKEKNEETEKLTEIIKTGKLKKFKDYQELNEFLSTNITEVSKLKEKESGPALELDSFADNDSENLRNDDILKQANNFSFVLIKNELAILRLNGLDSSLLTKINFDSRPDGILSSGSALVVYGNDEMLSEREDSNFNFVHIFDLSTPANPKKIHDLSFEGNLKDIFIEKGQLYLLTEKEVLPKTEESLPVVMNNSRILETDCDGVQECFAPEVFYFDVDYQNASFFSINVIDLENEFEALRGQVYLLSQNHQVYSSEASIFISYFETLNEDSFYFSAQKEVLEDLLTEVEKNKIRELELLSDSVLSPKEKILKISAVFESHLKDLSEVERTLLEVDIKNIANKKISEAEVSNRTLLHKIRLTKDSLDYYAMGELSGKILNNYSVLQSGENIYLASSNPSQVAEDGEERYYSNIYIFDLALRLVGKIENLSSKEEIYGVKFLGDRAFLVPVQAEAPLFVISLQNKTKPEFAGTLRIPGQNLYLRPIDKNAEKFLSFSYSLDGDSGSSLKNGLKLSLLDFSDLKSPKELDSYLIGDADSDSLVFIDEKSFYYSDDFQTLVFPASFKEDGRLYFSGWLSFVVKNDALELKGQLDHSLGGFYNQVDSFRDLNYFDNSVKRSFVDQNFVYSFSNKFFRSAELDDIDGANTLELITHSDDLLVSALELNDSEEANFEEGLAEEFNSEEGINSNENQYLEEESLSIPEYFEEPVYDEPIYDEPIYDEPIYDEPVYEEPVYEEPVYEEPVYDEPVYEEPIYE
ncbi:beta-propeller domain-containing protein [Patescibacteria group bacterium]|nr:beta-propeller domain-containing protein [Patescibacteria group bacterium]